MNPTEQRPDISSVYKTLLLMWSFLALTHFLFLLLIYFTKTEVFSFSLSGPLLGSNPVVVTAIAVVSLLNLVSSIVRPAHYIRLSKDEQKLEHVQTAMIIGCALAVGITLFGVFLAFAFEYQYFFVWFILGFVATCLNFPRRQDLENASIKSI